MSKPTCFHHECINTSPEGGLVVLHAGVPVGFVCKYCLTGTVGLNFQVNRRNDKETFLLVQTTNIDSPNQV